MVLHNLFFLVLASAAYFTLIPLFEEQVANTPDPAAAVSKARIALFVVLGVIYVLAVVLLEFVIMPLYVYQPIERMLAADAATQAGERGLELIPDFQIYGDEIGQIMKSRNLTVEALRRNEDELAAALRRLEAQDRLVSLGLLSASVAHELNTPLAVLNGSIEKLIESSTDAHTLDRLRRMHRVAQRIRGISESLLDFSRVRTQKMEPIGLHPLIDEAWALVAIDERASTVKFSNSTSQGVRVIANSDRMLQVFVNLLRNALNAVDPLSGQIEVDSKSSIRAGTRGVAISFLDNGHGIPAEVLPDIFDAFVSSRLDSRGTGLGLTVAQGIVAQHSGTIHAANRPSGGACLEVWLPSPT